MAVFSLPLLMCKAEQLLQEQRRNLELPVAGSMRNYCQPEQCHHVVLCFQAGIHPSDCPVVPREPIPKLVWAENKYPHKLPSLKPLNPSDSLSWLKWSLSQVWSNKTTERMLYFSMSVSFISIVISPLLFCWNIFFPKVKWISYKQQRNWVSRPLGKLKKSWKKNLMHGNYPFSCKTGLVADLSRNGEKQWTCCWFFLRFAGICFSMIWEWTRSQLRYPKRGFVSGQTVLVSNLLKQQ